MRDHIEQFGDCTVAVVTFTGSVERAAAHREHLGLDRVGVPVLVDTDRELYRTLGASRGSLRRVWSIGTLVQYAQLMRRGRRLSRSDEDTRQLGADAVLDGEGRLRRLWLPESPDRRPPVGELIDAVRRLDTG